jgi:hypothetical protein
VTDGITADASAILEASEGNQCWSKQRAYAICEEEISNFKTFKGFEKQVASKATNIHN